MPFWKKAYQKKQGVYYPQAIVQGKPLMRMQLRYNMRKATDDKSFMERLNQIRKYAAVP